jgi:hypothetical protein
LRLSLFGPRLEEGRERQRPELFELPDGAGGKLAWLSLASEIVAGWVTGIRTTAANDPYFAVMLIRGVREAIEREWINEGGYKETSTGGSP